MINFVVFDGVTGMILRVGVSNAPVEAQARAGERVIEGLADPYTQRVNVATGTVEDVPGAVTYEYPPLET